MNDTYIIPHPAHLNKWHIYACMSIHTEDVNKGLNGKISGAIVVWSSQHGLLLERAGIQSAWDDLACQDFLNALHSVSEPWKICCFHEAHESHTVTWTEAFLPKCQPNVCNLLSLNEFGMVFELMESYLLGRSQIVQISNAKPDILHMNWSSTRFRSWPLAFSGVCKWCFKKYNLLFPSLLMTPFYLTPQNAPTIYRVFHNCWNKAIGHKSRILNDTTMMITFIEMWKDNIL